MKFIKVLTNVDNIFKYANIFAKAAQGLQVAAAAIEASIAEIKKTSPDFKYISALDSVLEFVKTIHDAMKSFAEIFGVEVKEEKSSDAHKDELDKITGEIKNMLK